MLKISVEFKLVVRDARCITWGIQNVNTFKIRPIKMATIKSSPHWQWIDHNFGFTFLFISFLLFLEIRKQMKIVDIETSDHIVVFAHCNTIMQYVSLSLSNSLHNLIFQQYFFHRWKNSSQIPKIGRRLFQLQKCAPDTKIQGGTTLKSKTLLKSLPT